MAITRDPELVKFERQLKKLDEEEVKTLIERRHPEYAARLVHLDFLEDTYVGGREWFNAGNVFKYCKEGDQEYKERVARAYRFPHTREVVDLLNKYIFKADVNRNQVDASEHVKTFWKSSTVNRRGIQDFARLMSERSSVSGRIYICVDTNNEEPNSTLLAVKENGARVYAYTLRPQDVLDVGVTEDGDLNWVKVRERKRHDEDILSSGAVATRYRIWTTRFWALWEESYDESRKKTIYTLIGTGMHDLGRVPVFAHDHIASESAYSAMSLIDDIAYLDRAVANYLSNLDAIIQDQTFSQLIIPAQALMPDDDAVTKVLELGTKRMFTYDGTSPNAPQYISPDPRQASLILAVINKIINEIYHSVGLAGERTKQDNAVGIDNSSGVAKAYDFERLNAMLAAKAHSLQIAENTLCELVDLWFGEDVKPGSYELVTYPKEFDVRGLADEISLAMQLSLVGAPDEVRRQQMLALVDKLFPHLSSDLRKKMEAEIKKWPPEIVETATASKPPSAFGENKQGQNNKEAKQTT